MKKLKENLGIPADCHEVLTTTSTNSTETIQKVSVQLSELTPQNQNVETQC